MARDPLRASRLYVEDADAVYQQALAAGAVSITEMTSLVWGERGGRVRDPVGNIWWMREPRRAGQSRGDRTARHRAAVSRCHPVYTAVA